MGLVRGDTTPAQVGAKMPDNVSFPPGWTIGRRQVSAYIQDALAKHVVPNVAEHRKLWMMRHEKQWASLQPAMNKGDVRAHEAGLKIAERVARLCGLDMPQKVAMTDEEGRGIPLEAIRTVMARLDEQAQTVETTALPAPSSNGNSNGSGE